MLEVAPPKTTAPSAAVAANSHQGAAFAAPGAQLAKADPNETVRGGLLGEVVLTVFI